MVLLTTILFTREWIGDAVPILVVPIAALAFTPLGGYVAGKVNEQQQTSSQRYRPSQEYQQRDDPDRNYNEWQDMRDRSQADFDEPDSVSRAARTANNPDESDWGASMSNPVLSQQQQQTSDEQEWGESSSVPLYSTTAAEPRRDAVDSLQQGADGRRQPQEVSCNGNLSNCTLFFQCYYVHIIHLRNQCYVAGTGTLTIASRRP